MTLVANSRGTSLGLSFGKMSEPAKGKSAAFTVSIEFATSVNTRVTRGKVASPKL